MKPKDIGKGEIYVKKIYAIIPFILFLAAVGVAQETENAASSALTQINLPTGALRVLPAGVPAEINDGLDKIIEAGAGKLTPGEREVLAWSGVNYKKSNAGALINQLQKNLQAKGWTYEVGGTDGGITVFSVSMLAPTRRAVLGFYVPTDDALVLAWTEVLSNETKTQTEKIVPSSISNTANYSGNLVGTWNKAAMSLMADRNTITGATPPSNSSTFK